jgi:DNA-binding CsgD family transcriptional regulator
LNRAVGPDGDGADDLLQATATNSGPHHRIVRIAPPRLSISERLGAGTRKGSPGSARGRGWRTSRCQLGRQVVTNRTVRDRCVGPRITEFRLSVGSALGFLPSAARGEGAGGHRRLAARGGVRRVRLVGRRADSGPEDAHVVRVPEGKVGNEGRATSRRRSRNSPRPETAPAISLATKAISYDRWKVDVRRAIHRQDGSRATAPEAENGELAGRASRDASVRIAQGGGGNGELLVISFSIRPDPHAALTVAERAVVELVAVGCGNTEIARRRGVSKRTVANQIASVFGKLGVSSRLELVARIHSL